MSRKTIVILGVFALIWAVVVIPNQLTFRTYCLDLGLYTHVAYDYAHFRLDDASMFLDEPRPILADHFDLHLVLWAPLTFILGNWTLLFVQWLAVIIGAIGVFRLAESLYSDKAAVLALLVFCTSWGIYSALSFDFHSSVVAAMAVPWFVLALLNQRSFTAWGLFVFIVIAKENMGIWLAFVCLTAYLVLKHRAKNRPVLLWMAALALLYSVVVVSLVMPAITPESNYAHFNYSVLGDSMGSSIDRLFSDPISLIQGLWVDPTTGALSDVKIEMMVVFVIAGGWACLAQPRFILAVLPVFLFKLWNDAEVLWSLNGHYSIEFMPVIAWAIADFWHYRAKELIWPAFAFVMLSTAGAVHVMDGTRVYKERGRSRFYQAKHFKRQWDLSDCWKALEMIPEGAPVSAQSPYVPHLALRDHIYQYPIVKDADYIILNYKERTYPLDTSAFRQRLDILNRNQGWRRIFNSDTAVLFERVEQ
jgi:uncharacterized membrane protein